MIYIHRTIIRLLSTCVWLRPKKKGHIHGQLIFTLLCKRRCREAERERESKICLMVDEQEPLAKSLDSCDLQSLHTWQEHPASYQIDPKERKDRETVSQTHNINVGKGPSLRWFIACFTIFISMLRRRVNEIHLLLLDALLMNGRDWVFYQRNLKLKHQENGDNKKRGKKNEVETYSQGTSPTINQSPSLSSYNNTWHPPHWAPSSSDPALVKIHFRTPINL